MWTKLVFSVFVGAVFAVPLPQQNFQPPQIGISGPQLSVQQPNYPPVQFSGPQVNIPPQNIPVGTIRLPQVNYPPGQINLPQGNYPPGQITLTQPNYPPGQIRLPQPNYPTDQIRYPQPDSPTDQYPPIRVNPPRPNDPTTQLLHAGKNVFKEAVSLPAKALDAFKTVDVAAMHGLASLVPNVFGLQDLAHKVVDAKTKIFFTPLEMLTGVPRDVAGAVADAVVQK